MITAALIDLTHAVQSIPDTSRANREQVQTRMTSATAALRAVIDLFEPPSQDPIDTNISRNFQRVPNGIASGNLQRVSETPSPVSTSTPVVDPPLVPVLPPADTPTSPAHSSASPIVPQSESSECLVLRKRGRPKRAPKSVVFAEPSPAPPGAPTSVPRSRPHSKRAPMVDVVPTVQPPVVPSGKPTPVPHRGPPARPAGSHAESVAVSRLPSQRQRKPSAKATTNGHYKPNYSPGHIAPTTYSASDAARASAARAYGDDLDPTDASQPICWAFSRALGQANAALNLNSDGSPLTYRSALNGPNRAHWMLEEGKEISKLIDTDTMHATHRSAQPDDRRKDTTYYNPQVKEKPGVPSASNEDTTKRRVRGTIGGDRINYPGDVSARTADMEVVKVLVNSVVSTNAQWMTLDIEDYYLGTPLPRHEWLRIHIKFIPDDIRAKYGLDPYIDGDHILFCVTKGMYGLPQAGILAQARLCRHLASFDYVQDPNVPCLFLHSSNGISFTLVVDDFGVKYYTRDAADHLIACLRVLYKLKVDWTGRHYLGMTLVFDEADRSVALSMPGYISKLLERFTRRGPQLQAKSPAVYVPWYPRSGPQFVEPDVSPPLTAAEFKEVQEIVGCFSLVWSSHR